MRNDISFKKIFFRFIKDNGIYHFMTSQIKEEYNDIDEFIRYVCLNDLKGSIFSSTKVLTFSWGIKYEFWSNITKNWLIFLGFNKI